MSEHTACGSPDCPSCLSTGPLKGWKATPQHEHEPDREVKGAPRQFLKHAGCDLVDCPICCASGKNMSLDEFRLKREEVEQRIDTITGAGGWQGLLRTHLSALGLSEVYSKSDADSAGGCPHLEQDYPNYPTYQNYPKTATAQVGDGSHGLKIVDIFMSAGEYEKIEDEQTEGESYRSCHPPGNSSNCAIFRVRWMLGRDVALEVEKIDRSFIRGYTQPALSPNGEFLAYKYQHFFTGSSEPVDGGSGKKIKHLPSGESTKIEESDHQRLLQFPNWYSNNYLLYHTLRHNGTKALYLAHLVYSESEGLNVYRTINLNDETHNGENYSYSDASTERYDSGNHPPRIVVHGEEPGEVDATPKVFMLEDVHNPQRFILDLSVDDLPARTPLECHHASWSPSGDKIQCSGQGGESNFPIEGYEVFQKLIFGYHWDHLSNKWVHDGSEHLNGSLFEPKSPVELSRFFRSGIHTTLFPIQDAALFPVQVGVPFQSQLLPQSEKWCKTIVYKYAEWCGTDDYVVVTVYCAEDPEESSLSDVFGVFVSRVILVHLPSSEYWDLTKVVQKEFFPDDVNINGVYATCSDLLPIPSLQYSVNRG